VIHVNWDQSASKKVNCALHAMKLQFILQQTTTPAKHHGTSRRTVMELQLVLDQVSPLDTILRPFQTFKRAPIHLLFMMIGVMVSAAALVMDHTKSLCAETHSFKEAVLAKANQHNSRLNLARRLCLQQILLKSRQVRPLNSP